MSIGSLFSGISATDATSQLDAATLTASNVATPVSMSGTGSTATSVSDRAKQFQQLQQLSQSDPAEFKTVTADIAAQLQAQGQRDGGAQGQALSALAGKFQQASQTGSVSALEPKRHGHHHGGQSPTATAASTPTATAASTPTATAASAASAAYLQSAIQGTGSQIGAIISQALSQAAASTVA